MPVKNYTIAAIATPKGKGGVGIIRLSGALAISIAKQITHLTTLKPRYAHFTAFYEADENILDSGLCLCFPAPHSYTGEDVVELHGHGGTVVLDMLLRLSLNLGARLANAGEFTERAFLNNKLDLAQAEAVADLIDSSTEQSVRSAQNSLRGVFSEQINDLVTELTELRIYVEAAIDFIDEEIDFLGDGVVANKITNLQIRLQKLQQTAQQGRLLREGMSVVLAGKPNAGKSSLLNALAGHEAAIVTAIAGTTRDVLKEHIQLDGMPLHIIDTAGLRASENLIEQEGIRRAQAEIAQADCIVLVVDIREVELELKQQFPEKIPVIVVYNKIDLVQRQPEVVFNSGFTEIYLSLKPEQGLDLLRHQLQQHVGYNSDADSVFIARRRHIEALNVANTAITQALMQLQTNYASELVAEELRSAQNSLATITGKFSADDLLGKIFASFCIGK